MGTARTLRSGGALIVCAVAVTVLVGLSAAYFMITEGALRGSTLSFEGESAVQLADAGLTLSMNDLLKGGDGNVAQTLGRGSFNVSAVDNLDGTYTVTSTGVVGDARRTVSAVVEISSGAGPSAPGIAAVVAQGDVPLLGNIEIDGNDWSGDGNSIVGPGVLGVYAEGDITVGGSGTMGGNGVAPLQTTIPDYESQGIADNQGTFADGADDDGDGAIDEDAWDGVDGDGDGLVDEDKNSFPAHPDAFLGLPEGTLKAAAQANGTYFATETDYIAYVAANGGNLPGGKIYYLDFDVWGPACELSSDRDATFAADSSILVHHNATSTAQAKNMHGYFKGVILGDQFDHFNSGTEVLGTIVSFGLTPGGNAFGNGTAQLKFSSAALANLPSVNPPGVYLRSWRQVVTTTM